MPASLQEALQEKVNAVHALSMATEATKAKAKQLQERLEQTEAEAAPPPRCSCVRCRRAASPRASRT